MVIISSPYCYALIAAVLFGISVPASKYLLVGIGPLLLASLLYLGSAFFLSGLKWKSFLSDIYNLKAGSVDFFRLIVTVFAGGIIAPVALLAGLKMSHPATVSLMLNMELPFTVIIAWFLFRERLSRRSFAALALILISTFSLFEGQLEVTSGIVYVTIAAFLWGLDNNFSARIEGISASSIAIVKGLCGGGVNFILAMMIEPNEPSAKGLVLGLIVGFLCYGVSLVLYIKAARIVGAARGFMIFSLAPFIGALVSNIFFQEVPGIFFWYAFLGMAIGVGLLFYEKHLHNHLHESLTHNHEHIHYDGHHEHEHSGCEENPKHLHEHEHSCIEHSHQHYSDIHHRHKH